MINSILLGVNDNKNNKMFAKKIAKYTSYEIGVSILGVFCYKNFNKYDILERVIYLLFTKNAEMIPNVTINILSNNTLSMTSSYNVAFLFLLGIRKIK